MPFSFGITLIKRIAKVLKKHPKDSIETVSFLQIYILWMILVVVAYLLYPDRIILFLHLAKCEMYMDRSRAVRMD